MTGPLPDEDEKNNHLVIHYDAGVPDKPQPEFEPEPEFEPPPILQRYRYWLFALLIIGLLAAAGYGVGAATYDPPSRLPLLNFETEDALYGTNGAVAAERELLRQTFASPAAVQLTPTGNAFELRLPRTVADRLFGKRDEVATVFTAASDAGEFKFLVLSEGEEVRVVAIEAPLGLGPLDQPTGVFIAVDVTDPGFAALHKAVTEALTELDAFDVVALNPGDVYIFGPYYRGNPEALQARIEANTVMSHLAGGIEAGSGDVSLAAPMFLVSGGPSRGTINAVYHPARRVVMEPLWGESSTASLAHELVHAYLDTVAEDRPEVLTGAADYLEHAHPVLHGEVVGDLYQRLGREGRAEESLAFIVGAVAAHQTKTVATQRLLANPGNLQLSEAIFYSDIGLLVQYGLLPPCLVPNEGADGEITQDFYERAEASCDH